MSGTNTKVEAVIVVIEMWVYCLYVLLAPAAAFTDDVYPLRIPSTTEWAVNNTQGPRDLHGMSTHNHGNDSYYSANSHGVQEILGRYDMSFSTVSSDPAMENPELAKKLSDQVRSRNVGGDNNHFGSSDNGDHSYAKDHTHSNDSPSSATLSDHTLEDVTDS